MKWIRVASRVAQDAKIWELARLAGCDRFKAIGHLVTLWGAMTEEAKSGDLSATPDDVLEDWAAWSGRRGKFAAAVRATLCNERGVMAAWEKYQGAAIREHEADRRRKSGKRPPEPPNNSGGTSGGIPPEPPVETDRNSGAYETKRDETREVQQSVSPPARETAAAPTDADLAAEERALRRRIPPAYWLDLDGLLGDRPATARRSWCAKLTAHLEGMHGPAVPPERLGEAVREFVANGGSDPQKGSRLFDGYVRRVLEPPPPAAAGTGPPRRFGGRETAGQEAYETALAVAEEFQRQARRVS
jgi:hypothetical protein